MNEIQGFVATRTRFGRAAALSAGVVVLFVAWLRFNIGGAFVTKAFDDTSLVPITAYVAYRCARAAREQRGAVRRAWGLMAASVACWGAGEVIWAYYEVIVGRDVPFPSLADVGYLGAVPLAIAAVLLFPASRPRVTSRMRALLDGFAVGGSLLLVSWVTVLGPTVHASAGSVLGRAVGLAYPISDVVIASLAVFVATREGRGGRVPALLLATGLLSLAVADSWFLYLTEKGSYQTGQYLDAGWVAGYLLIGLAAMRADETGAVRAWRPSRFGAALPTIAVLLAIGLAGFKLVGTSHVDLVVFWNAAAIVAIVAARQVLTLFDNVRLNRDLETNVRDRTADLEAARDELRDAYEREHEAAVQLRSLDEMKNAFLVAISHELRTPLSVVLLVAETLERKGDLLTREQTEEMYARLSLKAHRLDALLRDLLDVDRLVRGVIEPRRNPTNMRVLAQSVLMFMDVGPRTVVAEVDEIVASVDRAQVERIVENLLSNAIKFTPPDASVHLRIRSEGDDLVIEVTDTGAGVPEGMHRAIFQPFQRGAATEIVPGTGIGLALVAKFAELHGGSAHVDNVDGGGARFTIVLADANPQSAHERAAELLRSSV